MWYHWCEILIILSGVHTRKPRQAFQAASVNACSGGGAWGQQANSSLCFNNWVFMQLVLVGLPPPSLCLRTRPLPPSVLINVSTVEANQGLITVKIKSNHTKRDCSKDISYRVKVKTIIAKIWFKGKVKGDELIVERFRCNAPSYRLYTSDANDVYINIKPVLSSVLS